MTASKYHEQIKELYGVPDVWVREKQRQLITGVSRVVAWKWEKEGRFPKRRKCGYKHVAWSMAELLEWCDSMRGIVS